jgi:ribosomal protein L37E
MLKPFLVPVAGVLMLLCFALLILVPAGAPPAAVGAVPPLSLEGLLDEALPEASEPKAEEKADNAACYVCHGDFQGEPLAHRHAIEGIGCVDCHGPSHDHRNDEDHVTPPDVMYAPHQIDPACKKCHGSHDAPARKVLARWRERCPEKEDPRQVNCTDCHFAHRMKVRTVRWDKKTRKLIIREVPEEPAASPSPASSKGR